MPIGCLLFRNGAAHSSFTLIVWRHRFVTRRHLRSLDRRELEDVGIDPAARQHEVAKWFWEFVTAAPFFGWRVVAGTFVLAVFGWGLGFYGPPVYLHAVHEARDWSVALVSAAVTVHFLVGAVVVANLPALYRRFGLPTVTKAGAVVLALGVLGWAVAREPWQLFAATLLSGAGWVAMGAAAVNAIVAPWFVRTRPAALAMAYNGASIGGVVFSPLWVAAIALARLPAGRGGDRRWSWRSRSGCSPTWCSRARRSSIGLTPDGDCRARRRPPPLRRGKPLPGPLLWRDRRFLTLAAGMALRPVRPDRADRPSVLAAGARPGRARPPASLMGLATAMRDRRPHAWSAG